MPQEPAPASLNEGAPRPHSRLDEWFEDSWRRFGGVLPPPRLAPMVDGGVHAEWLLRPWDVTVEFDLAARSAYFHALIQDRDEVLVGDYLFASDEGWRLLVGELCEVVRAKA